VRLRHLEAQIERVLEHGVRKQRGQGAGAATRSFKISATFPQPDVVSLQTIRGDGISALPHTQSHVGSDELSNYS